MPLQGGKTESAFKANIRELIASGYKPKQAVAIAYSKRGEKKKKKGK